MNKRKIIQVHIYKGDEQWVADCVDLPVFTQGRTLDELAENMKEAISIHLDGEDLSELGFEKAPSVLATFELELLASECRS